MDILQHDSVAAYEAEYLRVRATLIARGTSLTAYLATLGVDRQLAYKALRGRSHGAKARRLRADILRDVLAPVA